jgi:ornithine cyclodeaminase/alanine dehydrogenase-like protein (mu-crystallin family)
MRILSAEHVRAAIAMPRAIALMREAFGELSAGRVTMPERAAVPVPEVDGVALVMPAYLPSGGRLGLKIVGVFPENAAQGQPVVPAVVLLLDGASGRPAALLDATVLTAMRTGAASGLATDLLARPDATRLVLFGAGGQAPYQAEAVCCVRRIEHLTLVNRTLAHAERLAHQIAQWPSELRPSAVSVVASGAPAEQAVRQADVIVTATAAREPLFPGEWVAPGTHITAIGAFTPQMRELDGALLRKARIVVDHRPAARAEAGDLLLAAQEGALATDALYPEIGELVNGTATGRVSASDITCFKSVGVAAQDIVVASFVLREATRLGLGTEVAL